MIQSAYKNKTWIYNSPFSRFHSINVNTRKQWKLWKTWKSEEKFNARQPCNSLGMRPAPYFTFITYLSFVFITCKLVLDNENVQKIAPLMSFLLSENMHVTRYRLKKKTMREWNLRGCKKLLPSITKKLIYQGYLSASCF